MSVPPLSADCDKVVFATDQRSGSEELVVAGLNALPAGTPFRVVVSSSTCHHQDKSADDTLKDARSVVEHIIPFHHVRQVEGGGDGAEPATGTILCELIDRGGFVLRGVSLSSGSAAHLGNIHLPMTRNGPGGRMVIPDFNERLSAAAADAINWDAHRFKVETSDLSYPDLLALLTNDNDCREFHSHAGAVSADDVLDFATGRLDNSQKLIAIINTLRPAAPLGALVVGATDAGVPLGLTLDAEAPRAIVEGLTNYFRDEVFPMPPSGTVSVSFVDIPVAFGPHDPVALVALADPSDGDLRREAIETVGRGPNKRRDLPAIHDAIPTEVLQQLERTCLVWVIKTGNGHDDDIEDPPSEGSAKWRMVRSRLGGGASLFRPTDKVHWRRVSTAADDPDPDDQLRSLTQHPNVYIAKVTSSYSWVVVRSAAGNNPDAVPYGDLEARGYTRPDRTVVVFRLNVGLGSRFAPSIFVDALAAWRPAATNCGGLMIAAPMAPVEVFLRQRNPPLTAAAMEVLSMPDSVFSILVDLDGFFPDLSKPHIGRL